MNRPVMGYPPGSILSDRSIHDAVATGLIDISPFVAGHVQPSSCDLVLAESVQLARGRFMLATTRERIRLPANIQGQVHGRSSVGRLGVLVHFTAGLIDPGFDGTITLELMALDKPQDFTAGDRIAQITFHWLDRPADRPYQGRYQHQDGVVSSRFKHGDA